MEFALGDDEEVRAVRVALPHGLLPVLELVDFHGLDELMQRVVVKLLEEHELPQRVAQERVVLDAAVDPAAGERVARLLARQAWHRGRGRRARHRHHGSALDAKEAILTVLALHVALDLLRDLALDGALHAHLLDQHAIGVRGKGARVDPATGRAMPAPALAPGAVGRDCRRHVPRLQAGVEAEVGARHERRAQPGPGVPRTAARHGLCIAVRVALVGAAAGAVAGVLLQGAGGDEVALGLLVALRCAPRLQLRRSGRRLYEALCEANAAVLWVALAPLARRQRQRGGRARVARPLRARAPHGARARRLLQLLVSVLVLLGVAMHEAGGRARPH
mmetsp:Transcript_72393/g.186738  ORF Transcript_72393/g.186738 Transcript_72393/m.186738 type:complete len:334 (-) Transcript_72393:249-1250(-)